MTQWEDTSLKRELEIDGVKYHVARLHKVSSLVDECCDLINLEWKRSRVARLRSIENSSENFPMSLVLLRNVGHPKVVGHCKISRLSFSKTKVFVETVVIHPDLRGRGLGKFLMNECEEVCKRKNIKCIYLSTKGQEVFYEKLGYIICPPVSIYGCQKNSSNENINEIQKKLEKTQIKVIPSKISKKEVPCPPPPPLPLPSGNSVTSLPVAKTFMKKEIIY